METTTTEVNQMGNAKPDPRRRGDTYMKVIALAILIWIAFLISMIVLKGTEIGTPSSPNAALIAANERLLQMVQWTIGTVLTLGGALIGLNWYQSEKRYDHDRQVFEARITDEINRKLQEHKGQLDMLSQASILALDSESARTIKETVGPRDGSISDLGFTDRVISYYSPDLHMIRRRGIGRVLIEEIAASGSTAPGNPGAWDANQLARIKQIADNLMRDAPDLAQMLTLGVQAYELWHFNDQNGPTAK